MKLTHSAIQLKGKNCINESELLITVDYDPTTKTVDRVLYVQSYNWIKCITTDLTHIFHQVFDEALDSMVEQIDWHEEFLARIESKEEETESLID